MRPIRKPHTPKKSKPSTLEICAIVISILALFTTTYQSYLTKVHNLKSVEPRVNAYKQFENDYKIVIFNNGLGPAFVEKITYFANGEPLETDSLVPAMTQLGVEVMCYTFGMPRPGDSFKKEEEVFLIKIKNNTACSPSKFRFMTLKDSEFDFEILYSSIYGEQFHYRYSTNQQSKL
ncbi:hypothetical protein ACJEBH_13895 [Pseudomonas guariconensis]|uniref:hypothetical protein n=1 Tax=Pseudomonas guariconensis TaxID=1288410 RepID=UPI0038711A47